MLSFGPDFQSNYLLECIIKFLKIGIARNGRSLNFTGDSFELNNVKGVQQPKILFSYPDTNRHLQQ